MRRRCLFARSPDQMLACEVTGHESQEL